MANGSSFFPGAVDLSALKNKPKQQPKEDGISMLYDSEIDAVHRLLDELRKKEATHQNLHEFDQEIKGRFLEVGFVVDVVWEESLEGQKIYRPTIVLEQRTEELKNGFDHERQAHEIRSDLLGLGEGGVIKTDSDKAQALLHGDYGNGKHKH